MQNVYRFAFLRLLLAAFLLSNCAGFEPTQVSAPASLTPILIITPYWTPTSSPTIQSPTPAPSPTATPLPTPTPFTHTIVKGDLLGGIALQYGLTVEDLLAANPEVDPGLLKIGSTLVVPLDPGGMPAEPTPVSLPIRLDEPDCYPTGDGGAFCLMLATNTGDISVENILAKIGFFSADGDRLAEEIAHPPLNVLQAGESLPVLAFIPAPIEPGMEVRGELISALPLQEENSRYLKAKLEEVIVEPDRDQAAVQGQIVIPDGSEPPDYLWLAAVAYGDSGQVIGVRKWESPQDESCAEPTETESGLACLSFDLIVFSLGPEIEQVEVYVEAGYQPELEGAP